MAHVAVSNPSTIISMLLARDAGLNRVDPTVKFGPSATPWIFCKGMM